MGKTYNATRRRLLPPGTKQTHEYKAWVEMRRRCRVAGRASEKAYLSRGIRVCQRWGEFSAFLADVGHRPSPKHSLDRVNNDGHYEPGNVRWATHAEQNRNRSYCRMYTVGGETKCLAEWVRERGVNRSLVCKMLAKGFGIEEALAATPQGAKLVYTLNGETLSLVVWAQRCGVKYGTAYARIRRGGDVRSALGIGKGVEDGVRA